MERLTLIIRLDNLESKGTIITLNRLEEDCHDSGVGIFQKRLSIMQKSSKVF